MSLTPKRKLTEKSLAANRMNGPKSRGPATAAGKERSARSNLRHGFYSQDEERVMLALGEDPEDYQRMMSALQTDLACALEEQVVGRIGRAFWRMRRAERVQDGLAAKRIRTQTEVEELMVSPRSVQICEIYENLCALSKRINQANPIPTRDEIQGLMAAFGIEPPSDIKAVFPQYQAYWESVWKVVEPSNGDVNAGEAAQREIEAARKDLEAVLFSLTLHYLQARDLMFAKLNAVRSPENLAAMMAPTGENSVLMQRMEDSSLRQLWRLTNILMKVRHGALDETNPDETRYGRSR